MATWDDVAAAALALPGTTEARSASGRRRWAVRGRTFLRERPLHRKDLDEGAKAALLAGEAWAARAPRRLVAEHPLPPA